jgi:hypothetical protein
MEESSALRKATTIAASGTSFNSFMHALPSHLPGIGLTLREGPQLMERVTVIEPALSAWEAERFRLAAAATW